jgi:hypothetical protein
VRLEVSGKKRLVTGKMPAPGDWDDEGTEAYLYVRNVGVDTGQEIAFEKQTDPSFFAPLSSGEKIINIIPAFQVKGVCEKRRTHEKLYFAFGHAGAKLVHSLLIHVVALADIDSIKRRYPGLGAACGEREGEGDAGERSQHRYTGLS